MEYWKNLCPHSINGEIWKYLPNSKYMASSLGRIKSPSGLILKQQQRSDDYLSIGILSVSKWNMLVHIIVATLFVSNPHNKKYVNHDDGIKTNNTKTNLKWVTAKENTDHAIRNGLIKSKRGTKNIFCKLTDDQVIEIFKSGLPQKELAKMYKVSKQTINRIKIGKTWAHITMVRYWKRKINT